MSQLACCSRGFVPLGAPCLFPLRLFRAAIYETALPAGWMLRTLAAFGFLFFFLRMLSCDTRSREGSKGRLFSSLCQQAVRRCVDNWAYSSQLVFKQLVGAVGTVG